VIRSVASDGRPNVGGVFRPIDRPRVLERLATAAQYRITTIIAPAGFGKSVALRQFLATVPSSVVYDVPPDATTLVPFVRGFAEALADIAPGLRRSLATALDGARESETPGRDLGAWAATHVRSLNTLIALDDLHVGEGDREVSRFLSVLIDRTRDGPRWLLSSRSPLELPVASWLAYGDSDLMIDAVDLRFTVDEARESARTSRVAVRDEELAAIIDLVDGWPTALTFALRVSVRASDLRTVSAGTREMVYRYLAEQVWHSLDDRMRTFLRTVVFLPRMENRLATAAGFNNAASIIETLRERVAFVTVLDTGVYQLHDLFRDFVRRQIELEGEDALREAILSAGRVLEKADLPAAALERYLEVHATDDVARVLASANFRLLESGHYDVAERAVRMLRGSLALTPGVLAVRAAIEESHGRVESAEKLYESALDRSGEDLAFQVEVAWRFGVVMYQQGRFEAVPRLEALVSRADLSDADRANIAGSLAQVKALAGDLPAASRYLEDALALADFADDVTRARTYGRAATVAFFARDEGALERFTREGIRLATEAGIFQLAARLNVTVSASHAFMGRLPSAAWYSSQVVSNGEKAGDPQLQTIGLRDLMLVEAQRGNESRVAELDRQLASLSYRGPLAISSFALAKALVSIGQQQFTEAQSILGTVARKELGVFQERLRSGLLSIAAACGEDRQAALGALESYEQAVETGDDTGPIFQHFNSLAERFAILGNIALGRNSVAQRLLRNASPLSKSMAGLDPGISALLNRAPEQLADAVRTMRLDGVAGLGRLLEVLQARLEPATEFRGDLTAVELQVLLSMARGLSNKAIADDQRRAINTVRTHVSSILRKLGCESRGEAVAAARRLGLV